ncbi:MAG: MFS transporter, partial [Mycobacteriaceae bacterium]|nr:MFS transporter [Mycobacteriaceae bacterium]
AALSAWGLYRFNQILAQLSAAVPADVSLLERVLVQATMYQKAFAMMYGDIFTVTAVVCVVGALLGLFVSSSRHAHAEEPAAVAAAV